MVAIVMSVLSLSFQHFLPLYNKEPQGWVMATLHQRDRYNLNEESIALLMEPKATPRPDTRPCTSEKRKLRFETKETNYTDMTMKTNQAGRNLL